MFPTRYWIDVTWIGVTVLSNSKHSLLCDSFHLQFCTISTNISSLFVLFVVYDLLFEMLIQGTFYFCILVFRSFCWKSLRVFIFEFKKQNFWIRNTHFHLITFTHWVTIHCTPYWFGITYVPSNFSKLNTSRVIIIFTLHPSSQYQRKRRET